MTILAVFLLAVGLGILTYALWPRHIESTYGSFESTTWYRRGATGWYERWNERYQFTGAQPRGPRTVGNAVIGAAVIVGAVSTLLIGPFLAVIPTALAVAAPWLFFGLQSRKREQAITSQLVDFLDGVRSALETSTLTDAVRIAASNVDAPLSHELDTLISDLDARVDLSTALRNLAERNKSRAMAFTCATLDIAHTTGSAEVRTNLAELARMIRANERMADDIRNKTLILRVSAKMFIVIPTVALFVSFASFGVEPWLSPLGFGGIAFIVIVAVASSVGFSKLQQWQAGA